MNIINTDNPSDAFIKASEFILANGDKTGDIIETLNLAIIINSDTKNDEFDTKFRKIFGDDRIDFASSVTFIKPNRENGQLKYEFIKNKWKESYWGRMVSYDGEFNQIENILKTLRKKINVKRCELIIYDAVIDGRNMYKQPCLLSIDIKPRNNKLYMTAFFRSQRVSKSGYADYTALCYLNKFLCEEAGYEFGNVTCIATSCHIKTGKELNNTKLILNESI